MAAKKKATAKKTATKNVDVEPNLANVEIKPIESTAKEKAYVPFSESKKAKEVEKEQLDTLKEKDEQGTVKQTVGTRAQLRDAAAVQGKTVSTEQVAEAKAAEEKAAEEGAKKERLPMSATPRKS